MNYEEKLREIINSNSEYYPSEDKAVLAKYFPELKESEDDRIVRCLLNYFNHVRYNGLDLKGTDVDEVIAWLGEKKNTRKREIDDAYLQGICDAKHEIEKQGEKLNADKVIAWLVANICDFEHYVKLFKKDFGLC